MFIVALFTNNQDMEMTQVSINRWMDKKDMINILTDKYKYIYMFIYTHTHIYVYSGALFSHEKEENSDIFNNMEDIVDIMLSEILDQTWKSNIA